MDASTLNRETHHVLYLPLSPLFVGVFPLGKIVPLSTRRPYKNTPYFSKLASALRLPPAVSIMSMLNSSSFQVRGCGPDSYIPCPHKPFPLTEPGYQEGGVQKVS